MVGCWNLTWVWNFWLFLMVFVFELQLRELKAKLQGGNMELNQSVKEEALVSESENNVSEQGKNNGNISGIHGLGDFKDGSSDSDSSGVLKNESNFNAQLMMSPASSSSLRLNCASLSSPSPMNWFPSKAFQHQFGRMEEQSFFSAEEPCNFFWGDQAPLFIGTFLISKTSEA